MISYGNLLRRRVLTRLSTRTYADWSGMAEAFNDPTPPKKSPVPAAPVQAAPSAQTQVALQSDEPKQEVSIPDQPTGNVFGKTTLNDFPIQDPNPQGHINWSDSFHGLGSLSFSDEIQNILSQSISEEDIEITPDGLLYLPEIKYRRILNKSFGAGGWGLAPRSETTITKNGLGGTLTREYALICQGRMVGISRGEQDFFSDKGIATLSEGCKSNALMRCCKDLGIASELWDPKFIRKFKKSQCEEVFVEHIVNKRKKKIWKRKDGFIEYPFKKS